MSKSLLPLSIVFLGICILLGSWFISQSFTINQEDNKETENEQIRYDFIALTSDVYVIFDKQKGEYWLKWGSDSEWKKQESFSSSIE
ncbi:hypothetical protein [Ureibacillus manganicus]|uniref:Uncharacterized protein n=1 Tax=Ureibacillus manganicus DSM 26584 TaxID=1384049 RepID=A0A0A3I2F1_9BACL|nr:hypothetical protein [Ureibacillus manganicus]KGR79006.1 hypothetical protein CD29_08295 [Ureibacillus manganicus DSM 26584]